MNREFSKTKSKGRPPASLRSYIAGLLSGIFLTSLMYFVLAPNEAPSEQVKVDGKDTASDVEVDTPTYTFYGSLPNTDYVWSGVEDVAFEESYLITPSFVQRLT